MSNDVRIGGSVYGPVATGKQARATQGNVTIGGAAAGVNEIRAAIDGLRRAVDEHEDEIPSAERVRKDIDALEKESQEADPDPDSMRDTLRRIGTRVGTAATVVAAAEALRKAFESILT
jgi:hypothetical protein